jgi:DNA-binding transcriptional LysR family regulator
MIGGLMELKNLMTLKTIIQTGSFQNAAKKLNYTQSTITFQMQQLEQELSIKIFERIGRKMMLTQAGKDIMPYVDTILMSVEQLTNFGKGNDNVVGTLKVAIAETLLIYKMQPVIKAFREQAPNIRFSLTSMSCYEIRKEVLNGSVDIGIHFDVGGYNSTILTEVLSDYPLALVASPEIDKSYFDFVTPNQFKPINQISKAGGSKYYDIFAEYLQQKKIVLDNNLELSSIEAIKSSVINNLGIAYLPRFTVERELASSEMEEIETELNNRYITAICVYHKNKWMTPAMQLFINLLKKCI